jgi:hypothetical protein
MGRPALDLIGKMYGFLTVLDRAPSVNKGSRWKCMCYCGSTTYVDAGNLTRGLVVSCGCHQGRHKLSEQTRMGLSKSQIYRVWRAMHRRCIDTKYHAYHRYGGRGIKVCPEWHDFGQFVVDMAPIPKGCWLDRINNDGNYCKENCRWATPKVQANNRG